MKKPSLVLGAIALLLLGIAGFCIYLRFFWKPAIPEPFVNKLTQLESGFITLRQASVIVNYDDSGGVWLTGKSIIDSRKYSVAELPAALGAVHAKGTAFIAHIYTTPDNGIGGMLGTAPPGSPELETEIRNELIAAGFTPPPKL